MKPKQAGYEDWYERHDDINLVNRDTQTNLIFNMKLNPIKPKDSDLLWQLMLERDETINISHRGMPAWNDHKNFIADHPYRAWYGVNVGHTRIGACYITKNNEIGIAILKKFQGRGFAKQILMELMYLWPTEYFLANINPKNEKSIGLFSKMNFQHIQNTYRLDLKSYIQNGGYAQFEKFLKRRKKK